jgi:predicted site-specific integrase-resolvase
MPTKKGRKSKFTAPVKTRIIEALRAGTTYEIAAQYAGISRSTLYEWIKKGENTATGTYRTFYDNIKKAEAEGAVVHLGTISQASKKDWKAAAWLLERRHGYSKEGVMRAEEQTKEVELPSNMLELLRMQARELKASMMKAESSQSWQAYAALQRQLLTVVQQIRQIEAEEGMGDELDGLTDEQLLAEITSAIVSLPPILRQRLEGSFSSMNNVIPIQGKK